MDNIVKDPYQYNIYDTLDFVHKYKKPLLNRINKSLVKNFNRKTDLIYYDVTNFFFDIENPDDDIEHEDSTFKYKSKIENRVVKNSDGTTSTLTEKIVVYWSKSYYDKQKHDNKAFTDFVAKLKEKPIHRK